MKIFIQTVYYNMKVYYRLFLYQSNTRTCRCTAVFCLLYFSYYERNTTTDDKVISHDCRGVKFYAKCMAHCRLCFDTFLRCRTVVPCHVFLLIYSTKFSKMTSPKSYTCADCRNVDLFYERTFYMISLNHCSQTPHLKLRVSNPPQREYAIVQLYLGKLKDHNTIGIRVMQA